MFGLGGGGGGLSIAPTETSGTGMQETGSSAGNASGSINVLSNGSGTSAINLGATGIIVLALVALVGVIFVVREL